MSYTDKDLIRASQIAYFTINYDSIKDAEKNINEKNNNDPNLNIEFNYTLSELYEYSTIFKKSIFKDIAKATGLTIDEAMNSSREMILKSINDEKQKQQVLEKYAIIDSITKGDMASWKVVSYVDNNYLGKKGVAGKLVNGKWEHSDFSSSGDGLAAVVFETGDGQAITAFRGSEDVSKENNLITDWLASDGGLALSNRDTPQQKSVYKYMKDYVLNLGYDDITLTGHSLGGNLAMHAAVSAYEISSDGARAISNAVSFDGPGFSDGYMTRHYKAISYINGLRRTSLSHFTWSVVGVLLNQIEGTYDWKTKVGADNVKLGLFERHDMTFAQYDNKDNLLSATQNDYDEIKKFEFFNENLLEYLVNYPQELRPKIISFLFLPLILMF